MVKSLLTVVGLALALVGVGLYISSPAVSENDAIRQATRVTTGADGQKMYTVSSGEVHGALQQSQETNARRADKRQTGGVLALSGVVLLLLGMGGQLMSSKGTTAEQQAGQVSSEAAPSASPDEPSA
jgi:hypothetical protein